MSIIDIIIVIILLVSLLTTLLSWLGFVYCGVALQFGAQAMFWIKRSKLVATGDFESSLANNYIAPMPIMRSFRLASAKHTSAHLYALSPALRKSTNCTFLPGHILGVKIENRIYLFENILFEMQWYAWTAGVISAFLFAGGLMMLRLFVKPSVVHGSGNPLLFVVVFLGLILAGFFIPREVRRRIYAVIWNKFHPVQSGVGYRVATNPNNRTGDST